MLPTVNWKRRMVWEELGAVRGLMEGPWVFVVISIYADTLLRNGTVLGDRQLWWNSQMTWN